MAKDDFKWKCYSVIFNSKYIPLIHVVIAAVAILFLNQIRAKVGVNAPHENFAVVVSWSDRDDVTSLQVENPASVQGTMVAFPWGRGLSHGHHIAVHTNLDPSIAVIVDLQVDIVPSSGRRSQFSIIVLHAACQMTVRGSNRPVFNHCAIKRQLMLIIVFSTNAHYHDVIQGLYLLFIHALVHFGKTNGRI